VATRASDAEREACARTLRDHAAAGRLEVDELEERLGRVYGARDRTELRTVLRDLPRDHGRRVARAVDRIDRAVLGAHAAAFALCALVLIALWAVAGGDGFWPGLLLAPWAVVLAWHAGGSWSVRRMLRRRAAGELPRAARRGRLTA
jgi:Flp pilus assembly protein TadB